MLTLADIALESLWHCEAPLDAYAVHEALLRDLRAAQEERAVALWLHDHARADAATASMAEVTALLAASTDGMSASRERFTGRWPLWPEPVPDFVTDGDMSQCP